MEPQPGLDANTLGDSGRDMTVTTSTNRGNQKLDLSTQNRATR